MFIPVCGQAVGKLSHKATSDCVICDGKWVKCQLSVYRKHIALAISKPTQRVISEESEHFVASNEFSGKRSGYVFRTGDVGLGYYADNLSDKAHLSCGRKRHKQHCTMSQQEHTVSYASKGSSTGLLGPSKADLDTAIACSHLDVDDGWVCFRLGSSRTMHALHKSTILLYCLVKELQC
jgi:hypothetical protein